MVLPRLFPEDSGWWPVAEEVRDRVCANNHPWKGARLVAAHRIAAVVDLEQEILCEGMKTAVSNLDEETLQLTASAWQEMSCAELSNIVLEALRLRARNAGEVEFERLEDRWSKALEASGHDRLERLVIDMFGDEFGIGP